MTESHAQQEHCTWLDLWMKTGSSGPSSRLESACAVGIFTACVTALPSDDILDACDEVPMESIASSPDLPPEAPAQGTMSSVSSWGADFPWWPEDVAETLRDELDMLLEEVANDTTCPYMCQLTVPNLMTASVQPAACMAPGRTWEHGEVPTGLAYRDAGQAASAWASAQEQGNCGGGARAPAAASPMEIDEVAPAAALRCSVKEAQPLWISRSLRRLRAMVRGRDSHPRTIKAGTGAGTCAGAGDGADVGASGRWQQPPLGGPCQEAAELKSDDSGGNKCCYRGNSCVDGACGSPTGDAFKQQVTLLASRLRGLSQPERLWKRTQQLQV